MKWVVGSMSYTLVPYCVFNWYSIQAYASFSLIFHEGGENSCFTFKSVLFTIDILLPLFMLKNDILVFILFPMLLMKIIFNWYMFHIQYWYQES